MSPRHAIRPPAHATPDVRPAPLREPTVPVTVIAGERAPRIPSPSSEAPTVRPPRPSRALAFVAVLALAATACGGAASTSSATGDNGDSCTLAAGPAPTGDSDNCFLVAADDTCGASYECLGSPDAGVLGPPSAGPCAVTSTGQVVDNSGTAYSATWLTCEVSACVRTASLDSMCSAGASFWSCPEGVTTPAGCTDLGPAYQGATGACCP